MTSYYLRQFKLLHEDYDVQQIIPTDRDGIGFISSNKKLTDLVRNFYQANKDNVYAFWHEAHKKYFVSILSTFADRSFRTGYFRESLCLWKF